MVGQRGMERFFSRTSQEPSVSRIREESFPRSNVLALRHLDLHKGQPAKRELGPPGRAGLGRVPGLGKGPLGETWLSSESATVAPPPDGRVRDAQMKESSSLYQGWLPSPASRLPGPPQSLPGQGQVGGMQMSQQPSMGHESGEGSSSARNRK